MRKAWLVAAAWLAATVSSAPAQTCLVGVPDRAGVVEAVVRGPASPEEVRRQTEIAEAKTQGRVSAAYNGMPRIMAYFVDNGARHETIAAVTDGHMPKPGQIVRLASRHRDPAEPCAFIPWTVVPSPGAPDVATPATPNAAPAPGEIVVPIVRRGTNYYVPVNLNGALTVEFMIDSGASSVVMPPNIVAALGSPESIGHGMATLADGSQRPVTLFRLKSVTVGGRTVQNVIASGAPAGSSLLLGQSFLGRFKSWSIDNARSALVLKM